jgi:hypothetical protein
MTVMLKLFGRVFTLDKSVFLKLLVIHSVLILDQTMLLVL